MGNYLQTEMQKKLVYIYRAAAKLGRAVLPAFPGIGGRAVNHIRGDLDDP